MSLKEKLKSIYMIEAPCDWIKGADSTTVATGSQILKHVKSLNLKRHEGATDEELIDDFIVVHFAEQLK